MCFRRQFIRTMSPGQLAFLRFLLYVAYSLSPSLDVILLHFPHDWSNWYSLSFSSTTFQNFPGISYLLSEVSKFQHHTKPCSNRSVQVSAPHKAMLQPKCPSFSTTQSHAPNEVSKFQHHTKPCSKCSTILVTAFNLSLIWSWKNVEFVGEKSSC